MGCPQIRLSTVSLKLLLGSVLVMLVILIGGATFSALERPTEIINNERFESFRLTIEALEDSPSNRYLKDVIRGLVEGTTTLRPPTENWNYPGACFFCFTIVTTIGYGTYAPQTSYGRGMVIFYGVAGIACNALLLSELIVLVNRLVNFISRKFHSWWNRRKGVVAPRTAGNNSTSSAAAAAMSATVTEETTHAAAGNALGGTPAPAPTAAAPAVTTAAAHAAPTAAATAALAWGTHAAPASGTAGTAAAAGSAMEQNAMERVRSYASIELTEIASDRPSEPEVSHRALAATPHGAPSTPAGTLSAGPSLAHTAALLSQAHHQAAHAPSQPIRDDRGDYGEYTGRTVANRPGASDGAHGTATVAPARGEVVVPVAPAFARAVRALADGGATAARRKRSPRSMWKEAAHHLPKGALARIYARRWEAELIEAAERMHKLSHQAGSEEALREAKQEAKRWCRRFMLVNFLEYAYLSVGAAVYNALAGWGYFNSFYFCFVTLATIGFGDFAPSNFSSRIFSFFYIFFGLALVAYHLNVITELIRKLHDVMIQRAARAGRAAGIVFVDDEDDNDPP